jgi:alpha-tubulin suppressor-like RCC1 family protein
VHPVAVFGLRGSASGNLSGPQSVSAGWSHTCAVMASGWIECWGLNAHGDVGDGTRTARATPTPVLGFTSGLQATSAGETGCAITQSLHLSCWGDAAGNDFSLHDTAMPVTGITGQVDRVSTGSEATCALLPTAALKCWGFNSGGAVGDGTMTPRATPVPVKTLNGTTVAVGDVSVSPDSSCALSIQHGAYCWGEGDHGQLGDGANSNEDAPVSVENIGLVSQISAGTVNGCALAGNAPTAYCWGDNHYGAIGDGTTNDSNKPVKVVGLPLPAVQIETGDGTSCAVVTTGVVYCWGHNHYGEVGDGTTVDRHKPVPVSLPAQAQAVVGGYLHTCALLDDGTVYCWGDNVYGELGNGTTVSKSATPVQVTKLAGPVVQLDTQGGVDTCALISSPSEVQCWGDNVHDELGDGTSGGQSNTPQVVQGL